MVVPFLRRAHRRRLVLILTFVALFTIYLTYADKHADHRLAHMVPAPSPDGETVDADGAEEEEEDGQILGLENPPVIPMAYGTAARPPIKGLTNVLLEQPVELLLAGDDDDDNNNDNSGNDDAAAASRVQTVDSGSGHRRLPPLRRRRFVFVGDVHGQRTALDALLAKIAFDARRDHLVFTGDLVNKGPDSAGVVQLAMALGASAVRGKHEDAVLLAYASLGAAQAQTVAAAGGGGGGSAATADATTMGVVVDDVLRLKKRASIEAEGRVERARAMLEREADLAAYEAGENPFKRLWLALTRRRSSREEEELLDHDTLLRERAPAVVAADGPHRTNTNTNTNTNEDRHAYGDAAERAAAAALTPAQARWLADLPVILHLGRVGPAAGRTTAAGQADAAGLFHNVVVAHGGLVPYLPLDRQDPYAVMGMRSVMHFTRDRRRAQAHAIAEARIRANAQGRIAPDAEVDVPRRQVDAEFARLQKQAVAAAAAAAAQHPQPYHPHQRPGRHSRSGDTPGVDVPDFFADTPAVLLPVAGLASQGPDRLPWSVAWNRVQHAVVAPEDRTTVVYGHDAVTGLAVPPGTAAASGAASGAGSRSSSSSSMVDPATANDTGYTFGLDTGAVYGGQLTALIVEADREGRVQHRLEQVSCKPGVLKMEA